MKKNILFIYPEMMMGGSTTSFLNLLYEIDKTKFNVDIAFRKKRGALLTSLPNDVNVLEELDVYKSKFFKLIKFIFIKRFYIALLEKFKKNRLLYEQNIAYCNAKISRKVNKKDDIAISFLEGYANAYVSSNKVSAIKKICWIHVDYKNAGYEIKYDKDALSKVDKIAFVSKACLDNFKKLNTELNENLIVIENIISKKSLIYKSTEFIVNDMPNQHLDCLKFVTVCRLSTNTKGLDRIINIIRKLKNEDLNFKWYIIGGDADEQFIKLYKEFEFKDDLILLGEKSNPFPYYKFFDALVLASRFEGKPMVVGEALALNLPVITTKYSSASEQINNNINGIIVDNDERSLYEIIYKVINDNKILKKLKNNLISETSCVSNNKSQLEKIFDI